MERLRRSDREMRRFRAVEYSEDFRFVNLDRIESYAQAIKAVHSAIQSILDEIAPLINHTVINSQEDLYV